MTGRISLTLVVCAFSDERRADLDDAVRSGLAQLGERDECLVVIDHNDELARWAAERWVDPRLAVITNAHDRGLSGGRNTGVERATGEVIVFLDDDATLEPGALDALCAPFADPKVQAVGGRPLPVWPQGSRPRWFAAELDWTVGCAYTGLPTTTARVRNPIGALMAVRAGVFATVGGYLEGVGRVGSVPLGCEETELSIRLARQIPDAVVLHVPAATCRHRVTPGRATPRYLLRRGWAEGISKATISRRVGAGASLSAETRYTTVVLPRAVARELGTAVRGDRQGLAAASLVVGVLAATAFGYARGLLSTPELPVGSGILSAGTGERA